MNKVFILLLLLTLAGPASANCWYNGHMYPPGTVIGGLVCQVSGGWR